MVQKPCRLIELLRTLDITDAEMFAIAGAVYALANSDDGSVIVELCGLLSKNTARNLIQ